MTKETVILILSSLGIAQAFFLILYLCVLKKGNRIAHFFLAMVLLGLSIRIGKSILNVYTDLVPWQRNLGLSGILMVGPFLWFYGRALFFGKNAVRAIHYIHIAPFLLFVLFSPLLPNNGDTISYLIYICIFTHLLAYIGASVLVLYKNKATGSAQLFAWYRNLVLGVGLLWFFYMGNLMGFIPLYIGGAIFFSFLVYSFSFLLLQKHDFSLEKYSRSTMDRATSKLLMQRVKELFRTQESFLESTISLTAVAEKISCAPRDLSRAINENEGANFSEFVNRYRIERAKALLVHPTYLEEKIATIAYDCGFGNVTSFNLAFKANTQLTPTQYKNRFNAA